MEEKDTYIDILHLSLKKKNTVLDRLIVLTQQQEQLIRNNQVDSEEFQTIFGEKDELIRQLNDEDAGFETVYNRVKEELSHKKVENKAIIQTMQQLISSIMDKNVKLKALEQRNKTGMEQYFAMKKQEIKSFQMSRKTVSSYYKSMGGSREDVPTYYVDEKK